jgi:hypothetical protein
MGFLLEFCSAGCVLAMQGYREVRSAEAFPVEDVDVAETVGARRR